jgi:lipoate-protein ligase A
MENISDCAWRYLPLTTNDGPTNMAVDEAILSARAKDLVPNTIRLYQWSPSTVSIGQHQSVSLEVEVDEIERRGFQLVRRISGGGAVLHASGREITYAVIAQKQDLLSMLPANLHNVDGIYKIILDIIQATVAKLSVATEPGVVHCPALFIDGRKFSGNAQCVRGNTVLQHGTILLSVDPDEMYSVLRPPSGITKGHMVRSVIAKVAGLEEHLGKEIDVHDFESKFTESAGELLGTVLEPGALAQQELDAITTLQEKYVSDAWRYKYP